MILGEFGAKWFTHLAALEYKLQVQGVGWLWGGVIIHWVANSAFFVPVAW